MITAAAAVACVLMGTVALFLLLDEFGGRA